MCVCEKLFLVFFLRDVKMGYRKLKEKVREYNRREAKFYGNIIEKLSKVESKEADVSFLFRHHSATLFPLAGVLQYWFAASRGQARSAACGLWQRYLGVSSRPMAAAGPRCGSC